MNESDGNSVSEKTEISDKRFRTLSMELFVSLNEELVVVFEVICESK